MNFITTEEWSSLTTQNQTLKRKCNDLYTQWIRKLKKKNNQHYLATFLSKAYKSHRLEEKKHENDLNLCIFSLTEGKLIQGRFIYLEENIWKKSKIYIYQPVYTILARTCMILGDLMTFYQRWKQDEKKLDFYLQQLNSYITFTEKFIQLLQ